MIGIHDIQQYTDSHVCGMSRVYSLKKGAICVKHKNKGFFGFPSFRLPRGFGFDAIDRITTWPEIAIRAPGSVIPVGDCRFVFGAGFYEQKARQLFCVNHARADPEF